MTNLFQAMRCLVLGTAIAFATLPSLAQSNNFPERPVRLVVPFPPGGTSDISGRVLAEALAKELGQPVIVENRAGAGGSVGARHVAEAKPDGYTLLLGTSSTNGTNSAVYKNLPFDALKSFTPITRILEVLGVLAVGKNFPAQTYADFVALIKQNPEHYSHASSGNGGATHMAMEHYKRLANLRIQHVPYRGTGPALNDVIGGQIDIIYDTLASSMPHIKAGNLIPLALAAPQRLPDLAQVPTFAELGLTQANDGFWNGVLAPAGLSVDRLEILHSAISRALKNPNVKDKYAASGARVVQDRPEDFVHIIESDIAKWKKVAKEGGIAAD